MLKGFLKKIFPSKTIGQNIKAILCVPLGLSPAEKKQFEVVCFKAGIADVYIVPDVVSFALGNGLDIKTENSAFIVNIGGDTTNIATISNYSIVDGYNFSLGGTIINVAISKYIEENYNVSISLEQAETLKIEICSLFENYSASTKIVGINKKTNLKQELTISATELYPIIKNYYSKIAEAISSVIQSSDPEIVSDIAKNGIYFYGGGTSIIGLEKFMFEKLKFKININDIPKADILGTAELIKYPQLLKRIIKNN
jgi:rod shape-determining protein MreB